MNYRNISQVNNLKKVRMFHLKVVFNQEQDLLIYDENWNHSNGPAIWFRGM